MPNRNLVYEAIVLRTRESPSGDRILCLMTAEAGLLDVFVFGGPKNKLRSLATPYSAGRAFVYLDPPRDFRKLSDFEVRDAFSGLRESLKKLMAASLVAEILIKTSGGGGDYPEVLALALDTLRSLESLPEGKADYPTLLFLWRMVGFLGLLPEFGLCASCGNAIPEAAARSHSFGAGGFVCADCLCAETGGRGLAAERGGDYGDQRGHGLREEDPTPISAGAARWLGRAESLPFAEALRVGLDTPSLAGLKRLVFELARRAADSPLATLAAAGGIL